MSVTRNNNSEGQAFLSLLDGQELSSLFPDFIKKLRTLKGQYEIWERELLRNEQILKEKINSSPEEAERLARISNMRARSEKADKLLETAKKKEQNLKSESENLEKKIYEQALREEDLKDSFRKLSEKSTELEESVLGGNCENYFTFNQNKSLGAFTPEKKSRQRKVFTPGGTERIESIVDVFGLSSERKAKKLTSSSKKLDREPELDGIDRRKTEKSTIFSDCNSSLCSTLGLFLNDKSFHAERASSVFEPREKLVALIDSDVKEKAQQIGTSLIELDVKEKTIEEGRRSCDIERIRLEQVGSALNEKFKHLEFSLAEFEKIKSVVASRTVEEGTASYYIDIEKKEMLLHNSELNLKQREEELAQREAKAQGRIQFIEYMNDFIRKAVERAATEHKGKHRGGRDAGLSNADSLFSDSGAGRESKELEARNCKEMPKGANCFNLPTDIIAKKSLESAVPENRAALNKSDKNSFQLYIDKILSKMVVQNGQVVRLDETMEGPKISERAGQENPNNYSNYFENLPNEKSLEVEKLECIEKYIRNLEMKTQVVEEVKLSARNRPSESFSRQRATNTYSSANQESKYEVGVQDLMEFLMRVEKTAAESVPRERTSYKRNLHIDIHSESEEIPQEIEEEEDNRLAVGSTTAEAAKLQLNSFNLAAKDERRFQYKDSAIDYSQNNFSSKLSMPSDIDEHQYRRNDDNFASNESEKVIHRVKNSMYLPNASSLCDHYELEPTALERILSTLGYGDKSSDTFMETDSNF